MVKRFCLTVERTTSFILHPWRFSQRQVQGYPLYVRDELGVAEGTFAPIVAGLKFFYLDTLGYDWPLFTRRNPQAAPESPARRPQR